MTTEVHRHERGYEVTVDGRHAGLAVVRLERDAVVFTHTEIEPAFEGKGIGSVLVKGALDDVRAQDKRVVPLCPFVAGYIDRHPQHADLLSPSATGQG
jgi:predicted GNAT family acetyltransferase